MASASTCRDDSAACAHGDDPCAKLHTRPKKGILKTASSIDKTRAEITAEETAATARFDEMNIALTLHPADKDYGHMKIDEPKTPYYCPSDSEGEPSAAEAHAHRARRVSLTKHAIDPEAVGAKLADSQSPRCYSDMSDEDEDETEEKKEKRQAFEAKRKKHYDEAEKMKLAKQLIASELAELNEGKGDDAASSNMDTSNS